MEYYKKAFKHYADFAGRARRAEYWNFFLFNLIIVIALGIIGKALDLEFIASLYCLIALVPHLAVGARRLHDTDRSGWWLLIGFIPLIGAIILIVFFAQDSQPGNNKYGPNPKGNNSTPAQPSQPVPPVQTPPTNTPAQ